MLRKTVRRTTSARIPTKYGEFQLCYYTNSEDDREHLAFCLGEIDQGEDILVRVHSECFTAEVLGSTRCDCGEQLDRALQMISIEGRGALIYMRQEGRGIGLMKKIESYNLQDAGYDTVDANLMLGHLAYEREYALAARILEDLGIRSIRLITNNPSKIKELSGEGIIISERIGFESTVTPENKRYLQTKVERMGHVLSLKNIKTVTARDVQHEP
jgi:GTP cyclohydrolase II